MNRESEIMKGKSHSPKNARGFHNLEIGSLISFCFEYDSDKDELASEDPLFIEINDIVKAQFRQMNQYPNKTTKLITYEKVLPSIQDSAYETSLPVQIYQERINIEAR